MNVNKPLDGVSPSIICKVEKPKGRMSNRVLQVEDNKVARFLVKGMMKKYGLVVDCAQCLEQVKVLIAQHRYCLVLMDVGLPAESGFDITEYLRKQSEMLGVPIVGLTAFVSPHIHERAKEVGMDASYAKPMMRDMADEIVAKYVPVQSTGMLVRASPLPLLSAAASGG